MFLNPEDLYSMLTRYNQRLTDTKGVSGLGYLQNVSSFWVLVCLDNRSYWQHLGGTLCGFKTSKIHQQLLVKIPTKAQFVLILQDFGSMLEKCTLLKVVWKFATTVSSNTETQQRTKHNTVSANNVGLLLCLKLVRKSLRLVQRAKHQKGLIMFIVHVTMCFKSAVLSGTLPPWL